MSMYRGGESVADEDRVVVESFSDKAFAEAAASLLESEGIASAIISDDAGGELPNLDFARGVRLLVAQADLESARGILNAAGDSESNLGEDGSSE
jgi:hypothetical protein